METSERYRLVVLGSSQVGKTCVIRRFLSNSFHDRYKETVEDIYSRDLRVKGTLLNLDIIDTNYNFPDMRKLHIGSAHAFLLVFAVDNVASFKDVTDLLAEIEKRRNDAHDIPIVIAGNKSDTEHKKIFPETVDAWMARLAQSDNIRYLQTSAKSGVNIVEIFQTLLQLSGYPYNMRSQQQQKLTPHLPHRHMSTRSRSPGRFRPSDNTSERHKSPSNTLTVEEPSEPQNPDEPEEGGSLARFGRNIVRKGAELAQLGEHQKLTRHGSLMRHTQRLSLRLKHVAHDEPDQSDCKIA